MRYLEAMQEWRRIRLKWVMDVHEPNGPNYRERQGSWDDYLALLLNQERITDWDLAMFPTPACCRSQTIVRRTQ